MGAEPGSTNNPDHHDRDTNHTTFPQRVPPHNAPDGTNDNPPENVSDDPVWCYDQPAKTKRGKHRRYHGMVKRVGGSEGARIRRELAATIYELLVWAKQQQHAEMAEDSDEKGVTDDTAE